MSKIFQKKVAIVLSKVNLTEALDAEQKQVVDTWDSEKPAHIHNEIKRVFGNEHTITLPLHHDVVPNPDVEAHLKKHGFEIHDYVGGYAKDSYGRTPRIGSVLSKTKAPVETVKAFEGCPERKGAKKGLENYVVRISTHPHHVAGMTSAGHSWEHGSCMNFEDGSNNHYLKRDVKYGTHVAYLTHKDDHEIKAPISRIAIKTFENENQDHAIFKPERKAYGDGNSAFHATVNKFTDQNYKPKENEVYNLHHKLYQDSVHGQIRHMPEHEVQSYVNDEHLLPSSATEENHEAYHKHFMKSLAANKDNLSAHKQHIESYFNQSNIPPHRLDSLYEHVKHDHEIVNFMAKRYNAQHLNAKNISHMTDTIKTHFGTNDLHSEYSTYRRGLIANRHLPDDLVHSVHSNVILSLHPNNLSLKHVHKAIDDTELDKYTKHHVTEEVLKRVKPDSATIHKVIDNFIPDVSTNLIDPNNKHFGKEHLDKFSPIWKADMISKMNHIPSHAFDEQTYPHLHSIQRNAKFDEGFVKKASEFHENSSDFFAPRTRHAAFGALFNHLSYGAKNRLYDNHAHYSGNLHQTASPEARSFFLHKQADNLISNLHQFHDDFDYHKEHGSNNMYIENGIHTRANKLVENMNDSINDEYTNHDYTGNNHAHVIEVVNKLKEHFDKFPQHTEMLLPHHKRLYPEIFD